MSNQSDVAPAGEPSEGSTEIGHLADVDDGCGCVEVWEHLSDLRAPE